MALLVQKQAEPKICEADIEDISGGNEILLLHRWPGNEVANDVGEEEGVLSQHSTTHLVQLHTY